MTRRLLSGLVIVAGTWAVVGTSAQTPPPTQTAQQPTFRSRIDSVSVDVSVTDRQGRPVVDLQAGDFEVKENKQVQKIEAFKLVQIDELADPGPTRDILSGSDQERELARDGTRLIVIFLDDYHTQKINAMRMRETLARFVSELGGHDLVAVMTPLTPASAVSFSYNHDATARIVAAFDGRKYDYSPRNALEARYQQMPPEQIEQIRNSMVVAALESLCSYLGAIRDGRKMLLYVSEGLNSTVPMRLNMGGTVSGSMTGMNQMQLASDLQNSLNHVYQAAARANTSVSTLDPRGLSSPEMASDPRAADVERQIMMEGTDQLRVLANQTDGRAMVGSNDPIPALRQMMRELSAYYLLGYTATAAHDGKFHEIQVRVLRKDVEIHARKGYWAYTEEEVKKANAPAKPGPPRDVTEALSSLASEADLTGRRIVRTWMGAVRGATPDKATVTLVWETTAATPATEPADRVDHVTVSATSIYGDALYSGRIAPDPQAAGRPTGSVAFDAPAGGLRVRVVAENAKGLRLDAQDESFEVPSFAPGKAVVTAPVIYRARTVRDIQQLRAATAPMPAVGREFSRTERLLLRFQAFGPAGAQAAVTMQLLNQQGTVMAALPSPTATANGYEAEISLGPLPPGTYLIEIDADFGGEKAKSLVAIRVTG